ncbi:unnamed protein product [Camellia sinensis]
MAKGYRLNHPLVRVELTARPTTKICESEDGEVVFQIGKLKPGFTAVVRRIHRKRFGKGVTHGGAGGEGLVCGGYTINGWVKIPSPGLGAKGFGVLAKLSNVRVILNGGERVTCFRPDGYFSFHNVPAGIFLIEVKHH